MAEPRKVIIDSDMGTDDAVALTMALFDPRLEVLAVTATEGCVNAEQSTRNLQAIIELLDPPRYPRLGSAKPCADAPPVNTTFLYGSDGLGNSDFPVSRLQHIPEAEKLIIDSIRAYPSEVTILCLGPLTNVARAFRRYPHIAEQVDRLVIVGGCVDGIGNITQAAEFNFFFDPKSAHLVVNSLTTKSLVPLDVTRQVEFDLGVMDELPSVTTRAGHFLKQILPFAFRAYRQQLGQEHILLNDAVGMLYLLEPHLFESTEMAGQVETVGDLTRGGTVFDRRSHREWRDNMEVAIGLQADLVRQCILDRLKAAGDATA